MSKNIYIVYATYGNGEFDIQKMFFDVTKAGKLLGELVATEQIRANEYYKQPKDTRGYLNSVEYGIEEEEVEDA